MSQQLSSCPTCPIPPVSQVKYTRTRQASYGPPIVTSRVVDRCTNVPVAQTEEMTVVYTTSPWTPVNASSVDAAYQHFVAPSFNTA